MDYWVCLRTYRNDQPMDARLRAVRVSEQKWLVKPGTTPAHNTGGKLANTAMSEERGQRRTKREKVFATVELTWKDRSAVDCYAAAEALDISELGMRLEMKTPLDSRSYVNIRSPKLGLHGTASVRSCIRQGPRRFWIGLEFSGGLKWRGAGQSND
jgi:hypothetical protein